MHVPGGGPTDSEPAASTTAATVGTTINRMKYYTDIRISSNVLSPLLSVCVWAPDRSKTPFLYLWCKHTQCSGLQSEANKVTTRPIRLRCHLHSPHSSYLSYSPHMHYSPHSLHATCITCPTLHHILTTHNHGGQTWTTSFASDRSKNTVCIYVINTHGSLTAVRV